MDVLDRDSLWIVDIESSDLTSYMTWYEKLVMARVEGIVNKGVMNIEPHNCNDCKKGQMLMKWKQRGVAASKTPNQERRKEIL